MSGTGCLPEGALAELEAVAADEAELVRRVSKLLGRSLLAVTLMTVASHRGQARIVWVNEAFVHLTGYAAFEVIGQPTTLLVGAHVDAIHLSRIEIIGDHSDDDGAGVVAAAHRRFGRHWFTVEEHMHLVHGTDAVTHQLLVQHECGLLRR